MIRVVVLLLPVAYLLLFIGSSVEGQGQLENDQNILRELEDLLEVKTLEKLMDNLKKKKFDETADKKGIELEALSEELTEVEERGYTDPKCANYDHTDYGCVGQCITTSQCPGAKYISNLCPTQAGDIKCCFTANTDSKCVNGFPGGNCISTAQCPDNNYVSNYCPTKPAGVKCCKTKPTGTCSADCSSTVKQLACDVKENSKIYLIDNNGLMNSKGENDGADPKSNIRDMCNGGAAKRSSYTCSSGSSPGGEVCLHSKLLNYLLSLANDGYSIQVNALAGACHSTKSKHYSGTAVDLQVKSTTTSAQYNAWMTKCESSEFGGTAYGPGDNGHATHVHCQISP